MRHLIGKAATLPSLAVVLSTEATPSLVEAENPDVVIVAVGAEPIIPDIPGVDGDSVLLAAEVHSEGVETGERIVVVGGGLVGCETGLYLAQQGKEVTIVETLDEVASDANIMHGRALEAGTREGSDDQDGSALCRDHRRGCGVCRRGGERVTIPCDTAVIAVGYESRTDMVDALFGVATEVMTIGDCVRPRRVLQAIRTGYDAAMAI